MAMKRTVNGRIPHKQLNEFVPLTTRQATDERDKKNYISKMNALDTYNNRSDDIIAKQDKAKQDKLLAEQRVKEVKARIDQIINSGLSDRILNSCNEIGLAKTLQNFDDQLNELEYYSKEYLYLQTVVGVPRIASPYNQLMYNLAMRNPKFILHLPTICFTMAKSSPLPFSALSSDELHRLQAELEKTDIFENGTFKARYLKFFPSHIREMTDISDIAFALSLDAASFSKLDASSGIRSSFYQNPNQMTTIVNKAPKVLKYFSKEELTLFADNFISAIGYAIKKCPSILGALPSNFFAKYSPKYVFSNTNKNQIMPSIEPYFAKFPELEQYFNSIKSKFPKKLADAETASAGVVD